MIKQQMHHLKQIILQWEWYKVKCHKDLEAQSQVKKEDF